MKKRLIFFLFSLFSMIDENQEGKISKKSSSNDFISNNSFDDNITFIRSKKVSNDFISNDSFMTGVENHIPLFKISLTKNDISAIDSQYELSVTTTPPNMEYDNNNQTSRNSKKKDIVVNNDSDKNSDNITNEQMRHSCTNRGKAINTTQEHKVRLNDPAPGANAPEPTVNALESRINEMEQGSQNNEVNLLENSQDVILIKLTKNNNNNDNSKTTDIDEYQYDMMTYQHKIQKVCFNFAAYNNLKAPKAEIAFYHPDINILFNYDFKGLEQKCFILCGDGFINITKKIILNIGLLTNFDRRNLIKTNIEFTNIKYLDKITGGIIFYPQETFNISKSINIIMHKHLSIYSFSIYSQIGLWCTQPVLKIETTLMKYKKICINFSYLFAYDWKNIQFANIPRILFYFVN
jgi:hypothetical protein